MPTYWPYIDQLNALVVKRFVIFVVKRSSISEISKKLVN